MNDQQDVIASSFLRPLLHYADERDLVVPDFRARCERALEDAFVGATVLCDLLDELYQADPSPALGLRLGGNVDFASFGLVGYLVSSCATVGQALGRYRRFQPLLQRGLESWVEPTVRGLKLNWRQPVANTRLALEFSVAVFLKLYRSLVDGQYPVFSVGFPFCEPAEPGLYEALVGCPVRFDADAMYVEVPESAMAMRLSGRDPQLQRMLEEHANKALGLTLRRHDSDGFISQVHATVVQSLQYGHVAAADIAHVMGYPLRTFYRKLGAAGCSYRSILAEVRLRLARQFMEDPSLSNTEIGLRLGYSEQSSFIRAFRGWTGSTPADYRRDLLLRKARRTR
ncbi:AraC family transcriptional regulator ligand-binding domain-containing protein [Marinobacter lacisalsi]|uniref:AraC family transcriptional regulator ligand-binding domain-containing protein n=1 Tax=Marinobacter lacisalsi TaxID=475979 RepID=A0ABV8QD52_9GAMM